MNGRHFFLTTDRMSFGGVVIIDNAILLARGVTSAAIQITPTSGTGQYFKEIVVRKNVIGADLMSSGSTSGLTGIKVMSATNAIAENNVINDCENGSAGPLEYRYCTTFKAFNNENRIGTLLRAYNTDATRFLIIAGFRGGCIARNLTYENVCPDFFSSDLVNIRPR